MGTIKKNLVYNILYQILLVILPLITAPYIARTLGANAVGIYAYTNSIAYYFLLIAMLGFSNYGNRSIAAVRDDQVSLNRTFCSIYALQCITFTIAIIVYILYLLFFCTENIIIASIQILYVFSGLLDISWLYFGLEKFRLTVTRNVTIKILSLVAILAFVHTPSDLWKYTLIMMLGNVFSQLYLWFYLKRYVSFVSVTVKELFTHFKPVLLLFVPVLAYSIYKVMDKIMLGSISTYEQAGYYTSAEKLVGIPMGIITALGTVMLPRMSNYVANGNTEKERSYIELSTKFITIITSAVGFGLIGISDVVTPVFFGEGYEPCAEIIRLLAMTVFFVGWANVIRTQYLIPNQFDNIYVFSTIVGAILNLVFNISLIPTLQAAGAAIGTIVAEISVMLMQTIAIWRKQPIYKYILDYFPVLLIGAAMSLLVYGVGEVLGVGVITLILQILFGGLFFCGFLSLYLKNKKDSLWLIVYSETEKCVYRILNKLKLHFWHYSRK